jgi:hypothetical protein
MLLHSSGRMLPNQPWCAVQQLCNHHFGSILPISASGGMHRGDAAVFGRILPLNAH